MIDLHTHSTFSDGMCTPSQLVEGAVANGLKALAITDHDTVAGWRELKKEAEKHGIEPVPAVELAADYSAGDLHILGYFIDPNSGILNQHLDWLRQGRTVRNEKIFAKLNQLGFPLRWGELERVSENGSVGRLQIAKAMVARGYAESVKDAFSRYLGKARPAYEPRHTLDPNACIQLIHEAKGLAVLAHPYTLNLTPGVLQELITYLVSAGLDGIEVYYPHHNDQEIQTFVRTSNNYNLVMTGGSDFHGGPEDLKRLGHGPFDEVIPYSLLDSLKTYKASHFISKARYR